MSFKQKDNSGVLFKNDKKTTEKHPDYNGNCLIGGVDYFMAAWIKKSESGRTYMSFSFTKKDKESTKPQKKDRDFDPIDDDIPFN